MEAILVARQCVTDDLEVAVVVGCTLTTVNHTVTVQVLILDITRAVNEVVGLNACLVGYTFIVNPLAVSVLTVEVGFGEVAVGLKAPDVAPCLSCISIRAAARVTDEVFMVVAFLYSNFCIDYDEVCLEFKVFCEMTKECKCDLTSE